MEFKDEKLSHILSKIPEFSSKESLAFYYASYDFPDKQESLINFWKNAITLVLEKYFQKIIFTKKDMKLCFYTQNFYPLGFDKIIEKLRERNELFFLNETAIEKVARIFDGEGHEEKEEDVGLFRKAINYLNPLKYFHYEEGKKVKIMENFRLFFYTTFEVKFSEMMHKFSNLFFEKPLIEEKNFIHCLVNELNISEDDVIFLKDVAVYKTILSELDDIFIFGKPIKCIVYSKILKTTQEITKEKINFILNKNLEVYDKLQNETSIQIEILHEKIKEFAKKNEKEKSKFLIHRKKLFEKRFEDLSNKRLLFQKYQFSIEEDSTNLGMLNTFKELNSFTKTNKIDLNELDELKENYEELKNDQQYIAKTFSELNPTDEQEIMDEYDKIAQEIEQGQKNVNSNKIPEYKIEEMILEKPANFEKKLMELI